ncbi:MAG: hypothetical protein J6O49_06270 [Bacteroidaceae bacterium]|nr:hypothetical protein [Bacteroidaceae bacterium]
MDGIIWNSIGIMAVERVRYIYGEEKIRKSTPKEYIDLVAREVMYLKSAYKESDTHLLDQDNQKEAMYHISAD